MILFQCKIPGRARSKKNSKQIFKTKSGRSFISSSNEFKKWAVFASMHIRRNIKHPTIDFPCNLQVKAYYKNHAHAQDLDNVIASVCDVLEDCEVIKNDKLFYSYDGSLKVFGEELERVEVIVNKLNTA